MISTEKAPKISSPIINLQKTKVYGNFLPRKSRDFLGFLKQTISTENGGEKGHQGETKRARHPCRLAVTVRRIRDGTSEVGTNMGEETMGKIAVFIF